MAGELGFGAWWTALLYAFQEFGLDALHKMEDGKLPADADKNEMTLMRNCWIFSQLKYCGP